MPVTSRVSASAFSTGMGRRTCCESRPTGMTSSADAFRPARSSTSLSGTPVQVATPMAPRPQAVPAAGVPCWVSKKLRALPAHSIARVTVTWGSACRSASDSDSSWATPVPWTRSRHVAASIRGVVVWLRMKNRSIGVT